MPTKLEKTVKREIEIDGQPFTVAISPEGLKITQKGFRKGQEVSWKDLWTTGGSDDESASAAGESTGMGGGSASTGGTQRTGMPGSTTGGFGGSSESGFR